MIDNITEPFISSICSLCKSANIITDQELNETVCSNCGSILTEKVQDIDKHCNPVSKEDANSENNIVKALVPLVRHEPDLSTLMGKTNRDASGQEIDMEMRNRINRWRTLDNRSHLNSREKRIRVALVHLQKLKDKLSLPNTVIEKTTYIYRKIQERGLTKGTTIKIAITAALYVVCREMKIPRTLKELAEILNIDEKDVSKFYRNILLDLDLKVPQTDPLIMIVKIANICKISEKAKRDALTMMNTIIKKKLFTSKDPIGLAGAIVYLAGKINSEYIIQYQIANATGITLVTLRRNLRFIEECLNN